MKKPTINFVHIPKTAGTSFRNALESKLGYSNIIRDYSINQEATSSEVVSMIYDQNDFFAFKNWVDARDNDTAISGHYHAVKYARIFQLNYMVTFLREPVSRTISQYKHFVRHKGYTTSLINFARSAKYRNTQSKMLRHIPLSSIGSVGITEHYEESITLINHLYNCNLPVLHINHDPDKAKIDTNNLETYPAEELDEIYQLNSSDVELYRKAVTLHKRRLTFFKSNTEYTYGQFMIQENGMLGGWAFQHNKDVILEIDIHYSGIKQLTIFAMQYNMLIDSLNASRKGYVGFQTKIPKHIDKSTIECFVTITKQPLVNMIKD